MWPYCLKLRLLFSKNHFRYEYENERLPPISPSFWQKMLRASYTVFQWKSSHIAKPTLGSPTEHGWYWDDETRSHTPVMTTLIPALESVVKLSMCKCTTGCWGSEISSYKIDLQYRFTQNDVTIWVTNSKMFIEILLLSY